MITCTIDYIDIYTPAAVDDHLPNLKLMMIMVDRHGTVP